MYKIDELSNSIKPLEKKSFYSLGFHERGNFQEWMAKQPDVLGEDLLIIQKEFSGFDDTRERLDLLALDKQGALVIIENKLDDSGKDVTWQALKYASYCSRLSKANIVDIYQKYLNEAEVRAEAKEQISEFMEGQDFEEIVLNEGVSQRIILIAAKFRKEVTSTVLWLTNFKIRLQCFRATPFAMGEDLFLNVEQIIPTQDAEDYMIGMAEKAQGDIESQAELKKRHIVRREFWKQLIQAMNGTTSTLCQKINPRSANVIYAASGVSGVQLIFAVTKDYGRAALHINRPSGKEENKLIFDRLHSQKSKIETAFGGKLEWEPLDETKFCRIKIETPGNVFDREQWQTMVNFMTDAMCRLEKAVKEPLYQAVEQIKNL